MLKEFRDFAMRGNVVDLAVAVVIGAAFKQIVDAVVNDVIMPIIGIFGHADFTNFFLPLSSAVTATNLVDARKQGGVLAYGDFLTVIINFIIVILLTANLNLKFGFDFLLIHGCEFDFILLLLVRRHDHTSVLHCNDGDV